MYGYSGVTAMNIMLKLPESNGSSYRCLFGRLMKDSRSYKRFGALTTLMIPFSDLDPGRRVWQFVGLMSLPRILPPDMKAFHVAG